MADAVHGALTGTDDLRPGDDGFGQAVSQRARELGGLGSVVSRAARTANGSMERDGNGGNGGGNDNGNGNGNGS